MGFGSERPSRKIFYCKAKTKIHADDKELNPHFEIWEKNAEGKVVRSEKDGKPHMEGTIEGFLLDIRHSSYVYEDKTIRQIHVILVDDQMIEFKIDFTVDTGFGRGLMNRLITEPKPGWITLRVYLNTKTGYSDLYVANNDQGMSWKFDYKKDLESLVETFYNPKEQKDMKSFNKVNDFLHEHWVKHEAVVRENARTLGLTAARIVPQMLPPAQPQAQLTQGPASGEAQDISHEEQTSSTFTDQGAGGQQGYEPPTKSEAPDADDLPF